MVRLLVAAVAMVALGAAIAAAEPTRKVMIETEPPGATVYLNAKEDGPACQPTPCEVNAPVGETPMIIEKDGYAPVIDALVVPRGGKVPKPKYTLDATSGILDVKLTGATEATVKVDGKKKGNAPGQITVDTGNHHVVVTSGDKTLYDETLSLDAGQTAEINAVMPEAPPGPPVNEHPEDPLTTTQGSADVTAATPGPERPPFIIVSAVFDVGFRQFTYTNPQMTGTGPFNVGNDSEGGQLLAGGQVELFPMRLFGVDFLKNLSLLGRFEYGLNSQSVVDNQIMDTPPTTFWEAIEVTARNRWIVKDTVALDAIVGFTQEQYEFNGNSSDIALIPDVNYQAIEIGGRVSLVTSGIEPFIEVANRIVLSGGEEQKRFTTASANGLHAAAGLAAHFGKLVGRLEGQITSYGWKFSDDGALGYTASGASDTIELISLSFGYAY